MIETKKVAMKKASELEKESETKKASERDGGMEKGSGMFWADQIAREARGPQVVNDAKTPSGRVHVGSLRGVIIHDVIHKAFLDAGVNSTFLYGSDDYDPMDALPVYLPKEKYSKYMGMPLSEIPAPEGSESYADYYFNDFREVFESLGAKPKIYKTSELYKKGKFNNAIRLTLENASKIREIYKRVSGSEKPLDWMPLNVVCEKCGKIGTTKVHSFDGEFVEYSCLPNLVDWAKGCGFKGRVSPFDGNSKLPYKVEWPAKWDLLGVTIEGAGKDHSTAGGSRDIANAFYREVYKKQPPKNVPYEHFLIGGKKMSSSKGLGASAREVSKLLPPELLRFLMVRFKPSTAINFTPEGETIPRLFEDYDHAARVFFGKEEDRDPDVPRIFALSQVQEKPREIFLPSFPFIATIIQIPGVDVKKAFEKHKGSTLTLEEEKELNARIAFARAWLEKLAPENAKFKILNKSEAQSHYNALSQAQKKALGEFAVFFEENHDQNAQSKEVKRVCEKNGISTKDFFKAAYLLFVGREQGPRLLTFVNALDKNFVVERMKGKA